MWKDERISKTSNSKVDRLPVFSKNLTESAFCCIIFINQTERGKMRERDFLKPSEGEEHAAQMQQFE